MIATRDDGAMLSCSHTASGLAKCVDKVHEEQTVHSLPTCLQERAEGHFDESGHYIENRGKDDVNDAWLNSEEGAQGTAQVCDHKSSTHSAMMFSCNLITYATAAQTRFADPTSITAIGSMFKQAC